jgi:arabinose-5-phosphate isomerase
MMMALGDALAMALLQMRGFTAEEFAAFHPGGQLGRKLLLVRNIMHEGGAVPVTDISAPMSEALYIMTGKGFGCVAVTDRGRLAGIVSDGDLRRHMGAGLLEKTAGDVMTPNPATISPDAPAAKALGVMSDRKITSLLVTDENGGVSGIVHMHDCLRAGLE